MKTPPFAALASVFAFSILSLRAQPATISANGFEITWRDNSGFLVKQNGTVISHNSLLLCMEPPWETHWFYPVKHHPIVTPSANGICVATDPASPSPFFVEAYNITVLSPTTYRILVRGKLTQDVPAFVTHVVATIPEEIMEGADIEFNNGEIAMSVASYFPTGKTVSSEFSSCAIHTPTHDITIRVLKGPKTNMNDRRENPYLGKRGFVLMESKRITVTNGELFEQEFEFTVVPKGRGSAKASPVPPPRPLNETAKPATLKTAGFFGPVDAGKTLENIVREETPYNGHFTWDEYRKLLKELANPRYLVLPLNKFQNDHTTDKVVVGMRHDIDSHPEKALAMAEIEKGMGLSSTYFILHSAKYYGTIKNGVIARNAAINTLAQQLYEKGFEVGIHTDLFTMMWDHQFDPPSFMKEEIASYRRIGVPVTGAAAHGNGNVIAMGLNNMNIFSEFGKSGTVVTNNLIYTYGKTSIADHGLAYEAYNLKRDGGDSDIGGNFNGRTLDEFIQYLGTLKPGARIIILTHPEHWGRA